MNRFLKPALAGATLLTLAVPALASAQNYDAGRSYAVRGDYSHTSYGDHADRGHFSRADRHNRWSRRDADRYGWRHHFRRHRQHWGESRYELGWR